MLDLLLAQLVLLRTKLEKVSTEVPHFYRISYCSADATYDRVVAFIATNKNELMECHAFLCSKKRVAQAVALTISQAFNSAFELWKKSRQEQEEEKKENKTDSENHLPPLIGL